MKKSNLALFKSTVLFLFLVFNSAVFAQTESNKLDEKGNKHGLWKGLYQESKRPRYEGTFDHGKEVGIFKYFDDTKAQSVLATREFSGKDDSAYTIFYNQKKNKVSEGKVVNKMYEGEWKYYHQNATSIMTLENYKKGKLQGLRTVYYPDGTIAEETNYNNGIKEGAYKKYTVKGVVLEETNYKNGEFNGPTVYRDPLGNVVAKGNYLNGKKSGSWKFYENGKLVSQENSNKIKKPKKAKVKAN